MIVIFETKIIGVVI